MNKYVGILASLAGGIALGFIGGPQWIILIWAIIAALIGYFLHQYQTLSGALYGYAALLVYISHGYTGSESSTFASRLPLFMFLALFGGLGGIVCAWIGKRLTGQSKVH